MKVLAILEKAGVSKGGKMRRNRNSHLSCKATIAIVSNEDQNPHEVISLT